MDTTFWFPVANLAPYYGRLLGVQSLGLHHYWRRVLVGMMARITAGHRHEPDIDPDSLRLTVRAAASTGALAGLRWIGIPSANSKGCSVNAMPPIPPPMGIRAACFRGRLGPTMQCDSRDL